MNRQSGMTLIELVVGLAIVVLVAAAVGSMFYAGVQSYQARHTGSMVQGDLRFALDYMVRELRLASTVNVVSPTKINFVQPDSLQRSFYLSEGSVWRLRGTDLSPLAGYVQTLSFHFDPVAGLVTITMTSVTTVNDIKGSGLPLTLTTRVAIRN